MTTDQSRADFEAWTDSQSMPRDQFSGSKRYVDDETCAAWEAWQQSRKGMVPREVADRLMEALKWALGKEPSPCRCMDFAAPPHVCTAHRAIEAYNAATKP